MDHKSITRQPAPVEPGARIEVIDVLRGFAILGVLVMNMGGYTGSFETVQDWSKMDQWVVWAEHFLFEAKFYSFLSFLFGMGMAMQMLRAEERGVKFMPVYLRRLFFLLLIGVVHATFLWVGDILFIYACCGFLLLLFRKLSSKKILLAAFAVLLHPLLISLPGISEAFYEAFGQATEGLRNTITSGEHLYTSGTYFQVTVQRFWEANMARLIIVFAFGHVFTMFLFGLYAGRRKIFRHIAENLPFIRRVMWGSLVLGVLLNGLYVFFMIYPDYVPDDFQALSRRGIRTFAAPSLCFFYLTAIILLYQHQRWRQRLAILAPVGRMALTNYLMHSLVATTIFYGYGLGLYGEFGPIADLIFSVLFYALQIRLSAWWLERYRFGPAEWCWRSLTYGRLQPMRVDVDGQQAVPSRQKVALVAVSIVLPLSFILWRGWQALPQEDQVKIAGGLPGVGPTATLAPPTPRPTPTPTLVATPVVEPVTRRPEPAASRGDLWELALAFDPELALAEIETLTGPPYLGRYAGSPGGRAAGDYIAQRFAEYGLRPAGIDGTFFQPFPIVYTRLTAMPRLTVTGPAGMNHTYQVRRDFAPMVTRYMGGGQAEGPVMWANDCAYDDFDYTDVMDKVVLCWDRLWRSRQADVGRNALEHGAAGLLLLADPEEKTQPFDRLGPNREVWVGQPIPALRISQAVAEDLLSGTNLSLDDLTIALAPFPLSTTIRLAVPLQTDETAQGRNVLGVLPGRDPEYADELVILGAHYDHVGEDPDGTAWLGANDNASGVAVMLETARSWQAQGYVPRRTVLFAAWDAEEIGLDGSRYYVIHPQYSLTDTVAMLQLDMVGAGEDTLYINGEGTQTAKLNTIAHTLGLSTTVTRHGGSDHASFMAADVPASMLIWFGAEETEATAHYHRPLDTPAIIDPDKLATAGRLANLALLAQAEGEPAILDLLQTRLEAVNAGDLEAFLQTGTSARRSLDSAWFADVQSLSSPEVELEATGLRVVGRVATATVWIEVEHSVDWLKKATHSARLPVRFVHQNDGWRWDGPALAWQQPPTGFAVAYPPEYQEEAVELSQLAVQQYARLAAQLGLPGDSQASLILYPDQPALRGDTRLTLPANVETLIDRSHGRPPLIKLVYTPQLSQTERFTDTLVQLALAEVGVPETSAPWLWQGLPMAFRAETDPAAAQAIYLPTLYEALVSNPGSGHASPLVPASLSWAAVEFLREQVGWEGLGQLALALGQGVSPDEALTRLVGVDAAGFESLWRTTWQSRLSQVQTQMAALLVARQEAVLAADEAAFLRTIDPADPTLLAEERYWFSQVTAQPVERFELSGRPMALLDDGGLLAKISVTYKRVGDEKETSIPLTIRLAPAVTGYRWAGPLFESMAAEHVTIRYPAGYEQLAQALLPEVEAVYQQVTTDLQIEPDQRVTLKLYDQPGAFHASIALSGLAWLEAWTATEQSIKLLVNAQTTPVDCRQPLARQLTRSLLVRAENRFDWFHEGLAIYEAGQLSRADAREIYNRHLPLVARALRTNRFFSLADPLTLDDLTKREAQLAYAQSWDMVRYLVESYDQAHLHTLLDKLGQGQRMAQAFRETYDLGLAEFETLWREAVDRGHTAPAWVDLARTFDVTTVETHITELTGPAYASRQTGLPGEAAAAAYIAEQFAAYGLTPAGDDHTFFQRFPITYPVLLSAPRLWPLNQAGQPVAALRYRQDFSLVQTGAAGGGRVEEEVIWLHGDDYGPVRLAGKVVLRPLTESIEQEIEQAIAHGAGGLILVGNRSEEELRPKELVADEPDPHNNETKVEKTIPVIELTQDGFKRLLATAGYSPAELNTSPLAMPLSLRVLLEVPVQSQRLTSANVLGLLPGRDPTLRDEVIVVGAHYDHVGHDPDDRVCLATDECLDLPGFQYSGANDDTAAVGVLLEIARLWHEHNYRPARTVLFAAWGGQELDEAGSGHYITQPTLPLTQTVAMFQLEAVGGGRGFRLQTQGDPSREAVLRFLMEVAARQVEARLILAEPTHSGDQESFQWMGVPAVLIRWEKAEAENVPVQFDDEIDPLRLGQTGRTVTLAVMMLAQ